VLQLLEIFVINIKRKNKMEKGHYGHYTGNARHSHTPVTTHNVHSAEKDDAAHISYLKRDILNDQKHGGKYKDENQTADEKHISKLAEDIRYDKKHHSPLHKHDGKMFGDANFFDSHHTSGKPRK